MNIMTRMPEPPAALARCETAPARSLDQALDSQIAWWTQGLSPASLFSAAADWLGHLAGSPGKQTELLFKAQRKMLRLALFAASRQQLSATPCIEPLPQDRRFEGGEWQQWPFNIIYQAFLLEQQWWHNATTDVPGVTRHHEQLWTFAVRQALDMVAPSNFIATNPIILQTTILSGGANLAAGMRKLLVDTCAPMPPAVDRFRPGKGVALTPGKIVFRNRLIELIEYSAQTATVHAAPVLMVPPWIMKYYILDLSPSNSLVRYLVEHGHTVFMISWKNPDAGDRELGMDDYLQLGIMAAIDQVAMRRPDHPMHALGYCLGGTLLAIAAAAMARDKDARLGTMTLLASQVDFTEPGDLGLFIDESQLNFLDNVMASKGYLDGKQMEGAFALLNAKDMVWSRMIQNYLLGKGQGAGSDLAAWNADATRMPYLQQSEYLRRLYLNNDLAQGRYRVAGRAVALADLRLPMFVVGTERDTVSPWTSVYKINLMTDTALSFCLTTGGHNAGIVNSPLSGDDHFYQLSTREESGPYLDPQAWRAAAPTQAGSWWPAWERWLTAHDSTQVAAEPIRPSPGTAPCDAPGSYVLMP